jgi:hypothetical protein
MMYRLGSSRELESTTPAHAYTGYRRATRQITFTPLDKAAAEGPPWRCNAGPPPPNWWAQIELRGENSMSNLDSLLEEHGTSALVAAREVAVR